MNYYDDGQAAYEAEMNAQAEYEAEQEALAAQADYEEMEERNRIISQLEDEIRLHEFEINKLQEQINALSK